MIGSSNSAPLGPASDPQIVREPFEYDPFGVETMRDPHRFYVELRDRYPAYYLSPYDCWVISRFDDVWDGLLDAEHFSEVEGQVLGRDQMLAHHHGVCPVIPMQPFPSFNMLDPPVHTKMRQIMAPPFQKRAIAQLAPAINEIVSDLLDKLLERDAFDLNADFASQVAGQTVAKLMGIPMKQLGKLVSLVNRAVARDPGQPGFSAEGMKALGEIVGLLGYSVARRRAGRGRAVPLIDALISRDVDGRHLIDEEIALNLVSIVVGGIETVPKIIAGGLLELFRRPEQLAEVGADPDNNTPFAVEEMFRVNAPAQWFVRTVRKERYLAGADLKVGQRVMLLVASANRDPREFARADEFVWNRKAKRLISFGRGPHFCIGIHLARLEVQIMIRELLKRMPRFSIDEAAGEWAISEFQIGWTRLPLRREI